MQEKHLYEYAILRFVPKVEREEFINIGLVMFCKRPKFIKVEYHLNEEKIKLFTGEISILEIEKQLESFILITQGEKTGGLIGSYEIPDRFRWITAEKSTCIQTSRPHVGLTSDLESTFTKLFKELVL